MLLGSVREGVPMYVSIDVLAKEARSSAAFDFSKHFVVRLVNCRS